MTEWRLTPWYLRLFGKKTFRRLHECWHDPLTQMIPADYWEYSDHPWAK
jgi:hypothetical protein